MIRDRNYMAVAALAMAGGLTVLSEEDREALAKEPPPPPRKPFRWPYSSYMPPEPAPEIIEQRLRDAATKRARKAARQSKGMRP